MNKLDSHPMKGNKTHSHEILSQKQQFAIVNESKRLNVRTSNFIKDYV